MRPVLINLSDDQYNHLRNIKSTHNIPMSAYIRNLIKNDIERHYYSITEEYQTKRTLTIVHNQKQQSQSNPQWQSINNELKPILEQRRKHLEKQLSM